MKKYIYIAFAALCALTLASCDDFLGYASQGAPAQDNFFLSDEQANGAIENCYYGLFERDGMFSREIYWEQGCANDMVWGKTRGFNNLATLSYTGNEGPLTDSYNRIYNRYGLSKTNWVVMTMLNKQAKTELTAVEKRVLERPTSFADSTTFSPLIVTVPRTSVFLSSLTRMSRVVITTRFPSSFLL